jgi:hypothetical protein
MIITTVLGEVALLVAPPGVFVQYLFAGCPSAHLGLLSCGCKPPGATVGQNGVAGIPDAHHGFAGPPMEGLHHIFPFPPFLQYGFGVPLSWPLDFLGGWLSLGLYTNCVNMSSGAI